MDERQKQIIAECESFGEEEVRRRLHASEYSAPRDHTLVEGWLRDKESSRRDAREEKALSIARQAKIIAIIAIVLSTTIAVVVPIVQYIFMSNP